MTLVAWFLIYPILSGAAWATELYEISIKGFTFTFEHQGTHSVTNGLRPG